MDTGSPIAADTNLLVYAEALSSDRLELRSVIAKTLLQRLEQRRRLVIPAQALGELVFVLERKGGLTRVQANAKAHDWAAISQIAPSDAAVTDDAFALSGRHDLTIWDAIVVAAAARSGCTLLLSEDMQDGFVWRGLTIANPFAPTPHPLLVSLLD